MEDLYRAISPGLEIITRDDGAPVMAGKFTRYNQPTLIDSRFEGPPFIERSQKGVFAKSISESMHKIRVLFSHGKDASLGMKPLGTIEVLREEDDGPYFEVQLLRSLPAMLMEGLKAGVYGMSFHAAVVNMKENLHPERSDYNPDGLPERTYTELRLVEFGPTPFPAIDGTEVAVRSTYEQVLYGDLLQDPRFAEIVAGAVALNREQEPDASTPDPDEPQHSDEPTNQEEDRPSWLLS